MTTKLSIRYLSIVTVVFEMLVMALSQASAATVNLGFVHAATAEDVGPQDGVFDVFSPFNLGSINNNGYTSLRTALEFDLSSIPFGAIVQNATLAAHIGWVDGTRSLGLHSYAGDGTIQLLDFSRDGLVGNAILTPRPSHDLVFDVTGFIRGLVGGGDAFAGFNFREDPANDVNFLIFRIDMTGPGEPLLCVSFVPGPTNRPPVADASGTQPVVISANGTDAGVLLNGTRSSDPDGNALEYEWYEVGQSMPLGTGEIAAVVLPVGVHPILLVVDDAMLSATNAVTVEVITTAEALERLIAQVAATWPRSRPLVATLSAALASVGRGNRVSAMNQLQAFQNKVRAQVVPSDPALAATFIQAAQDIIDVLSGGNISAASRPHGRFRSVGR